MRRIKKKKKKKQTSFVVVAYISMCEILNAYDHLFT